jgi:hypothetical protein
MSIPTASTPIPEPAKNRVFGEPAPEPTFCCNCGTCLAGHFCHNCGQKQVSYNRPLTETIKLLLETWLSLDNKSLRSVKLLLTRPGAISKAFISGKRVSYSSPIKMYFFSSLLFFFLLQMSGNGNVGNHSPENAFPEAAAPQSKETLAPVSGSTQGFWAQVQQKIQENPHRLRHRVMKAFSYMFFALMPLFALLLKWFLKSKNKLYFEHLIFSIHVHVFGFLFISAYLVFLITTGLTLPLEPWIIAVGMTAYLLTAFLRVYSMRWWVAVIRLLSILAVYIFIFFIVMITSLVIAIAL